MPSIIQEFVGGSVMRLTVSAKRLIASAVLLLPGFMTVSCSSKKEDKVGNAGIVMYTETATKIADLGLTINKIRIWKSASNLEDSGVVSLVDTFNVEMWYTLDGEDKSRFSSIMGLYEDTDGNLYFPEAAP